MPRISVLHTKNLQTIYFNLFVVEHAYASRRNGLEIFAVVAKLLMISGDEIHAVRRSQLVQWLGRRPRSATITIPVLNLLWE